MPENRNADLWQNLFVESPQATLRLDQDGRIREVNFAARKLLCDSAGLLENSHIDLLIGPVGFDKVVQKLRADIPSHNIPQAQVNADSDKEILVSAKFTRLENSEPFDILCFLTDVGEAVYSERLLGFFAYADRTLDPTLDLQSVFERSVRFAAERMADWAALHMVQDGHLRLVAKGGATSVQNSEFNSRAYMNEVIRTGVPYFSPELIAVPIRRDSEMLGTLCLGINRRAQTFTRLDLIIAEELALKVNAVVERAGLYKKLEEMTRIALAASQAKSYFLANVSHEIRTPLGAILGFVELFSGANQDPGEQALWKSKIHKNANHLLRIIDDILDLSKVEAGRLEIIHENLDLISLLSDVFDTLEPRLKEKSSQLKIIFDTSIPCFVRSDSTRLSQILCNIVGNAVKFTTAGKITVRVSYDSPMLSFAISDTGPGLTQEQAARLFEPFSQAENSHDRRFEGTGLGLALSRRLAIELGGDVRLSQTEPGQGSTFTVVCKTVAVNDTEWATEFFPVNVAGNDLNHEALRLDGKQILVVDDSPDNQFLLGNILNVTGAQVEFASDGEEAIQKVAAALYDVILMDLQMPIKDGYATTRELRENGYDGLIIALTACAMKEDRARSFEAGCDFHLTKPISRNQLLATVARCLKSAPRSKTAGLRI